MHAVKRLLSGREPKPGKRDLLWPTDPTGTDGDSWHARLKDLRLTSYLTDVELEEFVSAAPFATAPWLVPSGSPDSPSYRTQFQALLDDPNTQRDTARKTYCQLALGQICEVVSTLEAEFEKRPRREWVELLTLVTSAPDNKPLHLDNAAVYHELVDIDVREGPAERSPIRNNLTRLVAANRLVANPFATLDPSSTGSSRTPTNSWPVCPDGRMSPRFTTRPSRAMPIMVLQRDPPLMQEDLVWATGKPFTKDTETCS